MPKNITPETREAFYNSYAALFEECLQRTVTSLRDVPQCREVVAKARIALGYSVKTADVDIFRPLFRGYRKWKEHQRKADG